MEQKSVAKERMQQMFAVAPIRKSILKMSIPAVLIMFIFGAYTYLDSILSINLAPNYYRGISEVRDLVESTPGLNYADLVRLFMNASMPMISVLNAFAFLFSMGVATRVAVNMGKGDIKRAKNTIRVGTTFGLISVLILIPIMLLISRSWMESMFPPEVSSIVAKYGFSYARIIIFVFPVFLMNNIFVGLLRNEGLNKILLITQITPIFINLGLDWVFMGALGMGVEGGALATAVSYLATSGALIVTMIIIKSDLMRPSVMFGLKMKVIAIFGIILVGIAPFLRNLANAVTITLNLAIIKEVSQAIYGNPLLMSTIATAIQPIFILTFAALFGVVQGARPVVAYNYGAKNMKRVRSSFWWSILYSFLIGMFFFVLFGLLLADQLLKLSQIDSSVLEKARIALLIFMTSIPLFALALGGMVLLTATDRIMWSIFTNMLFGVIVYIPTLFVIRELAINSNFEYLYWFVQPITMLVSSLLTTAISLYTLRTLHKNHQTLEEKIDRIYSWFNRRRLSK